MARIRPILPDGTPLELALGVERSFGVEFLNQPGQPTDITADTVTVVAKLDTTVKNLTVAKDTPFTAGRATVTVPASEIGATGLLHVDVRRTESGGNAQNVVELTIPVVAALAG